MLTKRINQVLYCLVAALIVLCVVVGSDNDDNDNDDNDNDEIQYNPSITTREL